MAAPAALRQCSAWRLHSLEKPPPSRQVPARRCGVRASSAKAPPLNASRDRPAPSLRAVSLVSLTAPALALVTPPALAADGEVVRAKFTGVPAREFENGTPLGRDLFITATEEPTVPPASPVEAPAPPPVEAPAAPVPATPAPAPAPAAAAAVAPPAESALEAPLQAPIAGKAEVPSQPLAVEAADVTRADVASADVEVASVSQVTEVQLMDVELPADLSALDDSSAVVAAGLALAAALLVAGVSLLFRKGYAGKASPEKALTLVEEGKAILLDVRTGKERREDGSPSVPAPQKGQTTLVAVQFLKSLGGDEYEVDEAFVESVKAGKATELEGGSIIVMDSSGAEEIAVAAAKSLTSAGLKSVLVLEGGADAWREAGLPWKEPLLSLPSLPSLPSLADGQLSESLRAAASTVSEVAGEAQKGLPVALATAGAAAAAVVVIAEAEAIMQLVASLTAGQFLIKKFLFAKDREETMAQIRAFLSRDAKGAAKEDQEAAAQAANGAAAEAAAPAPVAAAPAAATPAPAEAAAAAPPSAPTAPAQPVASTPAAAAAAAAVPRALEGAAAASTESNTKSSTDLPSSNRPLSPYAMYADLKPPTSPTPSPPKPPATSSVTPSESAPQASASEAAPPPPSADVSRPSSTDLPSASRPLSPYSTYADLKPPSSPSPLPPQPSARAPKPQAAAATPLEAVSSSSTSTTEAGLPGSTDLPSTSRPLSPYPMYADLKPPTSPSPKSPEPSASASRPSSTNLPTTNRPLSPYSMYADLKPPTTPTPKPPQQ